jgi:hypothetical protein
MYWFVLHVLLATYQQPAVCVKLHMEISPCCHKAFNCC